MKIMTIRAPDELQERLRKISKQYGMPRNALVLKVLWDYINQKTDQCEEVRE